jgi:5-methylcytosine-specific restriction endonuclease McrA
MERERFKERHSTTLNPLSPEVAAMIGKVVSAPAKPRILYPETKMKPSEWTYPGIATAKEAKRLKRQRRKEARAAQKAKPAVASPDDRKLFYASWEWRTLRMRTFVEQGRVCKCCGARPGQMGVSGDPVRLVVDHIKPLATHWNMRLDATNVQVLCDECNQGKGAWLVQDFR